MTMPLPRLYVACDRYLDTDKRVPLQIDIKRIDRLTRKHSAFAGFDRLIDAKGDYRPSISVRGASADAAERRELADAYDATQAVNGDARRAYRY